MRTAVDDITGQGVLAGVQAHPEASVVMGYDDGNWPDAATLAQMFPGKTLVRITVNPRDDEGDMLDVETGDAVPADLPAWVARRRAAGHGGPLGYFSEALRAQVDAAFLSQRVAKCGYFIAAYPGAGLALQQPGDVGHQYEDVGPYDLSVVIDYLPGIDTSPEPWPPYTPSAVLKPVLGKEGRLNAPCVSLLPRISGLGYHLVAADGGTFDYGPGVPHIGSLAGTKLNAPIIAAALTHTGNGILMAGEDGGTFAFGDAPYDGSMAGKSLAAPVVDVRLTPSGKGYWLMGADGGVFSFGDAGFYGSPA
jgi:hypothetical protein